MSSVIEERNKNISERAQNLIKKCDQVLMTALGDLDDARMVVEPFQLSVDSAILDLTFGLDIAVLKTTGGHSNTDHVVKITGDARKDRIEELKRAYQRRIRSIQPESRGEERWDKPKIPGERRRRIAREKDLPQAPPEPPPSGYIAFLAQMTTKIRHDRPNEHHDQSKVIREISKLWKYGLDADERAYYRDFAREARIEYQTLHDEYRATGRFAPPKVYERIEKVGPWVRINWVLKNPLEKELATYDTVQFPLRPSELDEKKRKSDESNEENSNNLDSSNILKNKKQKTDDKSEEIQETNGISEENQEADGKPLEIQKPDDIAERIQEVPDQNIDGQKINSTTEKIQDTDDITDMILQATSKTAEECDLVPV